ncbi:MAG: GNAT family N-acetyltransferase [Candidatus Micrarchaeota archaeon]
MVKLPNGLDFRQIVESDKDELDKFDCNHQDTADFFRNDVFQYHKANLGVTFALLKDKKIMSIVTIGMGAIRFAPNLSLEGIAVSEKPNQFPALKVGRLATCSSELRKGYAKQLIQVITALALELRQLIGCRYIIVDSYLDKVDFYKKLGFQAFYTDFTGRQTVLMFVLLPNNEIPKESSV